MGYPVYKSALKLQLSEAKRCSYPLRLDVYGSGCDHHCSYCYARAQMILGGWNNSRNLRHPFPRVADVNCLRQLLVELPEKKPPCVSGPWQKLRPLLLNRLPLRVGAVTDCFQRYMESRTHTGLELLRILTETKYPAQIVTKSDLLAENDYLEAMRGNQENLLIQVSMTTAHDDISSRLEPGAPPQVEDYAPFLFWLKKDFLPRLESTLCFQYIPIQLSQILLSRAELVK